MAVFVEWSARYADWRGLKFGEPWMWWKIWFCERCSRIWPIVFKFFIGQKLAISLSLASGFFSNEVTWPNFNTSRNLPSENERLANLAISGAKTSCSYWGWSSAAMILDGRCGLPKGPLHRWCWWTTISMISYVWGRQQPSTGRGREPELMMLIIFAILAILSAKNLWKSSQIVWFSVASFITDCSSEWRRSLMTFHHPWESPSVSVFFV